MPPEPYLLYFTGCADRDFALIQHETKLYAVNIPELTKHLFYQLMLVQFQSCDMMQLRPAPKLFDLIRHSALKLEKNYNLKSAKKHYLHFQKWQKNNFLHQKKSENCIFGIFKLFSCAKIDFLPF